MSNPSAGAAPRPVLVVMSDLMFRSRIDEVARQLELPLRAARSMEQLERHLANGMEPAIAIVDLECDTIEPAAAIARLRREPWGESLPVVGYAGHTNVEAIRAGRAAGANTVLARSAFIAQLPAILQRVAPESGIA